MCDTIVVNKRLTENRENILAKNSDRPLGECQVLEIFPAGTKTEYPFSSPLFKGTGADPEGSRYAVLGSRPYWLYGFEMGANEKGLFIGNEAEGSRMPAEEKDGILGMDLLRFALEACSGAKEAIGFIAALLKEYGQSANASRLFDRRYENSFILCDPKECWVMETAGRTWAAKKVPYFAAVSNCYTIRDDFDICSEDLEEIIREKRMLRPGERIDFAKAVTQPALRQWLSVPRKNKAEQLFLDQLTETLSEDDMVELGQEYLVGDLSMKEYLQEVARAGGHIVPAHFIYILTDHFEGEINDWRFGAMAGENVSICMHANLPTENQTAASMIMTRMKTSDYGFLWAPASPCMSIYIPFWWIGADEEKSVMPQIPSLLSRGGEFYEEDSLWWAMERLVSLVSVDEARFYDMAENKLQRVREKIDEYLEDKWTEASAYLAGRQQQKAQKCFDACTKKSAELAYKAAVGLCERISKQLEKDGGLYGPRKELLEAYSARTHMPL